MTSNTDITNRALAAIGTRTKIASLLENSNEAINANLLFFSLRDELLRMAPWNCATTYNNLTLITAVPGTPENQQVGTQNWNKTLPAPPWAYEYQYPADCLRDLFIVPQFQTGFAGGVPITTAITGGAPSFWNGPPQRFKVVLDQPTTIGSATIQAAGINYAVGDTINLTGGVGVFGQITVATIGGGGSVTGITVSIGGSYSTAPANPVAQGTTSGVGTGATFNLQMTSNATAAAINAGGTGYAVGDEIVLTGGFGTSTQLTVTAVNNGVITGVAIDLAGLYTVLPTNPVAQGSTTGAGTGATFNLTFGTTPDQRVILTNQENAVLAYLKRITDPNQWDSQFQQAMIAGLAARLAMPLTGSMQIAQARLTEANGFIQAARATDANEGLTINNVTPDWIRIRGIDYAADFGWSPNIMFDFGPMLTLF